MNRQLKELAEQAGYPDYMTYGQDLVLERFAELIVRECLSKVDKAGSNFNEQPQYNDKQNALVSEGFFWALESVKQQVKEHFGVEE
jgi:hypothetical protein